MKISHLFFFASCLFATACHSSMEHQLDKIDTLLDHHPDSALSALKQIDTSRITGRKNRAYYYLLYSVALDKNYIDVTDDSLITLSVDYYSTHGNSYDRMRSHYYQGIVRKNAGNYPAAIVSFEKAEQVATSLQDWHYLGLIHRNMGNIFNTNNNYIEARKHIKEAVSFFLDNRDSSYAEHATYSLAITYLNNGNGYLKNNDIDSCKYYLNILTNSKNRNLRTYSTLRYAYALITETDSLQRAISIFSSSPKSLLTYRDYGYCAYAFAKIGQIDSAKKWTDMAYSYAHSRPQKAVLNSLLFRVDTLEGRYPEALRKVSDAMAVQDSVTRVLLQQSLSVAQKNYYQNENALQRSRMQQQRQLFIAIGIILFLLFLSLLLFFQNRKQLREALLREQISQLAMTQQRIRKGNGSLVGALFMERMARLFGLSDQYVEAGDEEERSQSFLAFKKAARQLAETPELFLELEKNLNHYCSGIMDKLKTQVPKIKGTNQKIIALFFAGIPDIVIQSLMKRASVGSLRTLRSRFRQTIKEAHAPDETLFLDMLDTEKQPGRKQKNE